MLSRFLQQFLQGFWSISSGTPTWIASAISAKIFQKFLHLFFRVIFQEFLQGLLDEFLTEKNLSEIPSRFFLVIEPSRISSKNSSGSRRINRNFPLRDSLRNCVKECSKNAFYESISPRILSRKCSKQS